MKDYFSSLSDKYALYRPTYPQAIYDFIYPLLKDNATAWDCGTGNGQIAQELANYFTNVYATDISQAQLDNAIKLPNIHYSLQPAESTNFDDNSFDLVTVAQAVHWFNFEKFNAEVKRVGKPGSIICLIGYELNNITPDVDAVVRYFYNDIVGPYWDAERKHLENKYSQIPFPYKELETPDIQNIKLWKLEQLIGYLNTWSSVKHFIKKNGYNPLDKIMNELKAAWGNQEVRKVTFPIIFKAGRIK